MPVETAKLVVTLLKLAPTLLKKAAEAFRDPLDPSDRERDLLNTFKSSLGSRRALSSSVRDGAMDPVLISVDEARADARQFAGGLHSFPPGQVMAEAVLLASQRFLDKWADCRGKGYTVTYDGNEHRGEVPAGVRRATPLFEAFTQDLDDLRHSVAVVLDGIDALVKGNVPPWSGWFEGSGGSSPATPSATVLSSGK